MKQDNRWLQFGTSVFSVMSQAAAKFQAVNLAQGFPDFDGPQEIKNAAIKAILDGKNQYAPAAGIYELRELLAQRQESVGGGRYHPDTEVTVFSGATEAIFSTLLALLKPGDELIAFAPYYDCYPAATLAAGATFTTIPLEEPDWAINFAALERAITPRSKAIIINTPHNPTGKVFTRDELTRLAKLAIKHDLFVITDEVYEELVFDGALHEHLATYSEMRERTVTISSTSKTFSMTGWKIGYAFASAPLMSCIRAIHQFTVFCSATPLQWGMVAALKLGDAYYTDLRTDYVQRRNFLVNGLNECGLKAHTPRGTYFALANYAACSNLEDTAFALWLAEHAGVAAIPLSPLCDANHPDTKKLRYLRFAFCKNQATLERGLERLQQLKSLA